MEESPIENIVAAVSFESAESGSLLGYRSILLRLRKTYGLTCKDSVAKIQSIVDPEGKENRKKRRLKRRSYAVPGPNYMLHVDGHDKMRILGIYIHGAIDGYSWKVDRLKAADTNKNP